MYDSNNNMPFLFLTITWFARRISFAIIGQASNMFSTFVMLFIVFLICNVFVNQSCRIAILIHAYTY
jgi:hypothetical protein